MWGWKVALVTQQWSTVQFTDGSRILTAEECYFPNLSPGDTCLSLGINGLQENPANKMGKGVSLINHNKDSETANTWQSMFLACVKNVILIDLGVKVWWFSNLPVNS